MAMCDQDSILQEAADLWIKGEKGGGPGKVIKGDAVYLSSRPRNGLIGRQVGAERFPEPFLGAPESDANLNWNIGSSPGSACGLKVDRGKLVGSNRFSSGGRERHPGLRGLNMGWFYNGDSGAVS